MRKQFIYFILSLPIILFLSEYTVFRVLSFSGLLANPALHYIFVALAWFCPIFFIVIMLADGRQFLQIKSWLYILAGTWLGLLVYLFTAAVISALAIFADSLIGFPVSFFAVTLFFTAIAIVVTLWGILVATNPRIVHLTVESPALRDTWKGKTIVLVSDTHLGHIWKERFMEKVVRMINDQKPDIVFHAGDIIDAPVFDYDRGFAPLLDLRSTLGTFYTEGNHEGYSRDYKNFRTAFEKITTITDMTDKRTTVLGTQILGLSYKNSETEAEIGARLDAIGFDPALPSIVILHNPFHTKALADKGVSIVLSGHTHGGQCFPMTLIARKVYGHYCVGATTTHGMPSVTTYGVGAAISPMRVGTISEIVVLKII